MPTEAHPNEPTPPLNTRQYTNQDHERDAQEESLGAFPRVAEPLKPRDLQPELKGHCNGTHHRI